MALVQYPQITGDGLGNALRPPLRLGDGGRGWGMNRAAGRPNPIKGIGCEVRHSQNRKSGRDCAQRRKAMAHLVHF
jgi:hypothetical protein